jgi:hypothetical protein
MSLTNWLADGSIRRQAPAPKEIQALLAVADRDLADANLQGLSRDRRFATAYGAALQLATVVLRASGYRTSANVGGHHWRTIKLMPEFMGAGQNDRVAYLDSCRRARNQADYDRIDVVTDEEVLELLEDVLEFRGEVLDWLEKTRPDLL